MQLETAIPHTLENPEKRAVDIQRQEVAEIAIALLIPSPNNARTHSRRQIKHLARSIDKFGFVNPVLIDAKNRIIAGHGRVMAAQQAGRKTVPTLKVDHLSDDEIRAYLIADNRITERAGWNKGLLSSELRALCEIGFDVEAVGFEIAEVDIILEEAVEASGANASEDEVPVLQTVATTEPTDIWICGQHRLICGDAMDEATYVRLLDGQRAEFVTTDPCNVPINGQVSMSDAEMTNFLEQLFKLMAAHSAGGSIHQFSIDWRRAHEMTTAGRRIYSELLDICVWCKTNARTGSFYRSQHELFFVWQNGNDAHIRTQLERHDQSRTNVWTYPDINTFEGGRSDQVCAHPTVKPVALVADAIKDCSLRGGIVLDPFAAGGTVLIAAERTGRKACAIEIDPLHVDAAVRRWQAYSGKCAVHANSGLTFEQMEENRVGTHTNGIAP